MYDGTVLDDTNRDTRNRKRLHCIGDKRINVPRRKSGLCCAGSKQQGNQDYRNSPRKKRHINTMPATRYINNEITPTVTAYGNCVRTCSSKSQPEAIADTAVVSEIGEQ